MSSSVLTFLILKLNVFLVRSIYAAYMIDRTSEYELTNNAGNRFINVDTLARRVNEMIDAFNALQARMDATDTRWNDLQNLGTEMRDVARELTDVGDALESL